MHDGAAQLHLPRQQPRTLTSGARSRTPSRSRSSGASPSRPRATAACWSTRPTSSCATRSTSAPRLRPGNYRVDRTRSAIDLPWTKGFPKNTEVDTILTFANDGAAGGGRGGGGGPAQGPPPVSGPVPAAVAGSAAACSRARVASVTPTADAVTLREHHTFAELPDSNYKPRLRRSARRLRRAAVRGLRGAARHADGPALRCAGTASRRSIRRHASATRRSRSSTTSIAARRNRFARRCSKGRAGGTRRSRRPAIATRSGRAAARRRRPDGHPLQHDQLGPPLDARLEHRRDDLRSAHRRDHQGDGHARLAARSAGLPDLRGPARAVQERHRDAGDPRRRPRSRASASSRRTRSATRSASGTSTTTAPRGGSR